jgi:hypothetical protein
MDPVILRTIISAGFAIGSFFGLDFLGFGVAINLFCAAVAFVLMFTPIRGIIQALCMIAVIWGAGVVAVNLPTPRQLADRYGDRLSLERVTGQPAAPESTGVLVKELEELKQACDRGLLTAEECAAARKKLVDKRLAP